MPRPNDAALRLAAWAVVAPVGALMVTQTFGLDPARWVAAAQATTPYLVLLLVPVLAVALRRRWWSIGAVGGAIGLGGFLLATPLVIPTGQPAPDPAAATVDVAAVNLLYENPRSDDIGDALLAADPDVIVFTEYTAEHQAVLLEHPLAERFPHREERDGLRAGGTAVWSRFPLTRLPGVILENYDVEVDVATPDGTFRLWAVHPPTPLNSAWKDDLTTIADRIREIDEPLLVAGDFNASYWHPAFRDVLRAGVTSAHIANGAGWATSWPVGRVIPPFVQIDHALTNAGLVSTDVRNITVPGSDHRGLVVTVAPAG